MSADNCIGILRTVTNDGKYEWRVANHRMVWNDEVEKIKTDILDKLSFLFYYRNSTVLSTEEEANEAAEEIFDNTCIVEYGISEYDINIIYPKDNEFNIYSELREKCINFGNKTQKWNDAYAALRAELSKIMSKYC